MDPHRLVVSAMAIVLWISTWPAAAGQIERQRTYDLPRGQVAVDGLSIRATPSPEAEIVGPALWGQRVAIIDDTAAPVTIDGRQDRWVLVSNAHCVDDPCEHFQAGWVPDSVLAFDGRFQPLDDWRSGTIAGYDDRSVFAYAIEDDGMFVRQRLPCTAGGCDPANSIAPGIRDADADAALMAVVAYRRGRLALIAADVLNLQSEPSTDGEIVGRLPRGSEVERLDIDGAPAARGAPSDDWVRVRLIGCLYDEYGNCPQRDPVGWVVDSYLAFEDRLEPVTAWRAQTLGEYAGDYGSTYEVAADGSVAYTVSCRDYDDPLPDCTEPGRLYRYRNLILVKSDDGRPLGSLYVNDLGSLCIPGAIPGFEYSDGCER